MSVLITLSYVLLNVCMLYTFAFVVSDFGESSQKLCISGNCCRELDNGK